MKKINLLSAICLPTILFYSCVTVAPVHNNYENAAALGKNNIELSGNYSHYIGTGEGQSEDLNDNYGFKVGYGIASNFDLKLRYERLIPATQEPDEKLKVNYFSVIPKFSWNNKHAFLMPVSMYGLKNSRTGGATITNKTYSIAPQFIETFRSQKNTSDLSLGIRSDILFNTDDESSTDVLLGLNIGAGFSSDLSKWAIRPEVGYLFKPGESGSIWSMGVAFQFIIPHSKKSKQ